MDSRRRVGVVAITIAASMGLLAQGMPTATADPAIDGPQQVELAAPDATPRSPSALPSPPQARVSPEVNGFSSDWNPWG